MCDCDNWRTDIETVTKGSEMVITESKCGKVIATCRLSNGRWNGYATNELPVRWQPLPKGKAA